MSENRTKFSERDVKQSSFSDFYVWNGYTYTPGMGFVSDDPAAMQRRQLRYVAGRIGIAMVFYILLSVFVTLPVVLMYAAMGLPVSVNFETMKVYGTQFMLQIVNLTSMLIKLGIPTLFLAGAFKHLIKIKDSFVWPSFRTLSLALPMVLAGSVLGAFVAQIFQKGMAFAGYYISVPAYSVPDDPFGFIFSLLLLTVFPALLEELLFRGLILQGLRCFGDGIALLVSSILFALAHFNLMQSINALLMGLLIGYFVLRSRSVWTGVILHFAVNLLSFLEIFLFRTAFPGHSEFVENFVCLILLLGGLISFVFFVRREPTAFSIPLLTPNFLSSSKRLSLCLFNSGMLLAFLMFFFWGIQTWI